MGNCVSAPEDVLKAADLGARSQVVRRTGDIHQEYAFKQFLGDGVEGEVKLAEKDGKLYAVKVVDKVFAKELLDDVVHEVEMLSILGRHPGIVEIYEVWENNRWIHVVQEYCRGGTLLTYLEQHKEKMTQARIADIIRQIVDAVAHCHARGIIHRDLKEENIMFSSTSPKARVKLIDFGNSLFLSRGKKTEGYAGTTFHSAPEVERGERYDHRADLFSVGVLSYLIISGEYPFGYSEQGYQLLLEGKYKKCAIPPFTEESKAFIARLLTRDTKTRLTAARCRKQPFLMKPAEQMNEMATGRDDALARTMYNMKQRADLQARIVKSLNPRTAEDQEDLLDNLVALEAWLLDYQAETKTFSQRSRTRSVSKISDTPAGGDLSAPTITTVENLCIDFRANGFDRLAAGIEENLKEDLDQTINLDEVLRDLKKKLEQQEQDEMGIMLPVVGA